jgi:hypothetical protein
MIKCGGPRQSKNENISGRIWFACRVQSEYNTSFSTAALGTRTLSVTFQYTRCLKTCHKLLVIPTPNEAKMFSSTWVQKWTDSELSTYVHVRVSFDYYIRCSKCWPFAATHPLRRRIMVSLTRSSWPGRFLIAAKVATMRSHSSVGKRCAVNFTFNVAPKLEIDMIVIRGTRGPVHWPVTSDPLPREMVV